MADVQAASGEGARKGGAGAVRAEWDWNRRLTPAVVLHMLPVVGLLVWAYWYPLWRWEKIWRHDSAWGHGYLIPVIAVLIAHFRLTELKPQRLEPCWWGWVPILAGLALRIALTTLKFALPSEVTFLLVVGGVLLLLLGWSMFRVLWIPVAYLALMIPWDPKYYEGVALPLQTLAATVTERFLPIIGMVVSRRGNVLELVSGPLTVAEACSGLRLLFAFVALGVMMAYMYRRPLWERLVIMGSSIPIAVFCNTIRVTLMAILSDQIFFESQRVAGGTAGWSSYVPMVVWQWFRGGDLVSRLADFRETVLNPESFLHQGFGFAMLALAFVLMRLELKVIDLFFIEDGEPAAAGGSEGSGPPAPAKTARPS